VELISLELWQKAAPTRQNSLTYLESFVNLPHLEKACASLVSLSHPVIQDTSVVS
jgi:hypothetical protein